MRETLEQFLARGGQIEHPAPRALDDRPQGIDVMRQMINGVRRFDGKRAAEAGRRSGETRRAKAALRGVS